MNVKKLNGNKMNPRSNLTSKHVCEANLEEVFKKVTKFKTIINKLHLKHTNSLLIYMLKFMGHHI